MNTQTDHEAGRFSRSELKSFKTHVAVMVVFGCVMCFIVPKGMGWTVVAALTAMTILAPPLTILVVRHLKRKSRPDA
jgi:hypothetical protein